MRWIICDTAGAPTQPQEPDGRIGQVAARGGSRIYRKVLTLLVLDATTGLNGVEQARVFSEVSHVDGIALTKLDGTAKGRRGSR